MSSLYQTLTINQIKEEVPGVKTFVFGGQAAKAVKYLPGQYLTLVMMDNGQEVRRSYSITSTPVLDEPLAVGVKRIENGVFSRWLIDRAEVGDEVLTIGASGFFTLPDHLEQVHRQVFFWAAGSGITPIFSLLKTILYAHPMVHVVLVYSNSSPQVTIFRDELTELSQKFKDRFQLVLLYSNAVRLDQARLHKGLLKQLVRQYALTEPKQLLCYVCGPENYRRLCVYGLRELQVPLQSIRQENFNTQKVALKVQPTDTEPHMVSLLYRGQKHQLTVQFPDTILQAARKAGIVMPYSCEAGKCGNCAAQCLSGQVWMSYNEVLTDKAILNGLTLTCVGYPVGGDVTLRIL